MIPAVPQGDVAEQPILWLGMTGFAPEQRAQLEAFLTPPRASPSWRVCAFGEADAWWVNGAKVRVMPDGNLKVAAGLPTEHAMNLNLEDVDRPVAFASPIAWPEFEPRYAFDPLSEPSIRAVLMKFESWLWLARAQFVLGARIVQRSREQRQGVYHVGHSGKLLAVIDFQNAKAAVLPRVHPVDLWDGHWVRRPVGAHDLPESFVSVTTAQLAWSYVRRSERDLLPPRYRTQTIHYRHVPGVPLRWLRDSQLMLLRELSAEPATLEDLRQRTSLPLRQIEHDLTCLYYSNAITTTRAKAAVPVVGQRDSQLHSSGPGLDSLLRTDPYPRQQHDITAPALLEHKRVPPAGGGKS